MSRTLTRLVDESKSSLGGLLGAKGSVNVADLEPLVAQLGALVKREEEERAVVAAFLKASNPLRTCGPQTPCSRLYFSSV